MDVLLGVDFVIDICSKNRRQHPASTRAYNLARKNKFTLWISTASLQTLYQKLLELTLSENEGERSYCEIQTSNRLRDVTKNMKFLSASSEDTHVFRGGNPLDHQLRKALERLGKDAILLTNNEALLKNSSNAFSPKDFESHVKKLPESKISMVDLGEQQRVILADLEKRIHSVLNHGKYILGPEVHELEKNLAEFAGTKHAITCSSGTDALLIPLMAYGIGRGDAVFTTPFTFIATAEVIHLLGATPVFVDIDPQTFNIDTEKLREAITKVKKASDLTPRGIIAVDLFGLPSDYKRIMEIAKESGLFVVEDAAQGFGAQCNGSMAGSLADCGATSFFPAKPLGCYGDGGAVFTNNEEMAEKIESIRVHGKGKDKYDNVRLGVNGRLDTLQAAILLPKLAIFPEEIEARKNIASLYTEKITKLPIELKTPFVPNGYESAWAQYSVLSEHRDQMREHLAKVGIPSVIYYPKPLHLQSVFSYLGYKEGDFPITESITRKIFSLPMNPYLTENQIDHVVEVLADFEH